MLEPRLLLVYTQLPPPVYVWRNDHRGHAPPEAREIERRIGRILAVGILAGGRRSKPYRHRESALLLRARHGRDAGRPAHARRRCRRRYSEQFFEGQRHGEVLAIDLGGDLLLVQ